MKQLLFGLCIALTASAATPTLAVNLTAELFPLTGEVRFRNPNPTAASLVFYSITSASGKLNGANGVWLSVEDTYDASGNGFIDNGEWVELSATSTQLAEGALDLDGGRLPGLRSVSLGKIWTASPISDLVFSANELNGTPITFTTQFALAGDYFVDGVVNQQDYITWRANFGSTTMLDADGNLNGVVDAADFIVWHENFGNALPAASLASGGGSGLALGGAVPEPASAGLVILGCSAFAALRRRE